MAIPGNNPQGFTGLGDLLAGQTADETEELRKKRMQQLASGRPMSAALGYDMSSLGGAISGAFGNTGSRGL